MGESFSNRNKYCLYYLFYLAKNLCYIIYNVDIRFFVQTGENMKRRRPSWTHLIPFILVAGVLGLLPLAFISFENFVRMNGSLGYIYFGFAGFIGGLCLLEAIRLYIGESRENRLLRGDDNATRAKATFLNSQFKTSTNVNGRRVSSYHHVRYGYNDERGRFVSRTSFKLYNPLEIQYLQDLGEFDILMKGKVAVIVECLDEQVIADYYSNRGVSGDFIDNSL